MGRRKWHWATGWDSWKSSCEAQSCPARCSCNKRPRISQTVWHRPHAANAAKCNWCNRRWSHGAHGCMCRSWRPERHPMVEMCGRVCSKASWRGRHAALGCPMVGHRMCTHGPMPAGGVTNPSITFCDRPRWPKTWGTRHHSPSKKGSRVKGTLCAHWVSEWRWRQRGWRQRGSGLCYNRNCVRQQACS